MGSVGDRYDNAMCESFFATLECELLARERFAYHTEGHQAVFAFLEGWYNLDRRQSSLQYLSPYGFELRHAHQTSAPNTTEGQNRRESGAPPLNPGRRGDQRGRTSSPQPLNCPPKRGRSTGSGLRRRRRKRAASPEAEIGLGSPPKSFS
jgi:Integrase core domain